MQNNRNHSAHLFVETRQPCFVTWRLSKSWRYWISVYKFLSTCSCLIILKMFCTQTFISKENLALIYGLLSYFQHIQSSVAYSSSYVVNLIFNCIVYMYLIFYFLSLMLLYWIFSISLVCHIRCTDFKVKPTFLCFVFRLNVQPHQ